MCYYRVHKNKSLIKKCFFYNQSNEIFDFAEIIASSKNESMSKIGNILMSPKAQMVYMDDDF